jgi:hypothetical protein
MLRCVVDNCAAALSAGDASTDAGDGRACVEQSCTNFKLVPLDVQQATLRVAPCMVQCAGDC